MKTRSSPHLRHVRSTRLIDAARFHATCRLVSDETGIDLNRVMKRRAYGGKKLRKPVAGMSMYLAHVVFGIGYSRLARITECRRQSIQRAINRIEDRRDDPQFDAFLAGLEKRLRSGGLIA